MGKETNCELNKAVTKSARVAICRKLSIDLRDFHWLDKLSNNFLMEIGIRFIPLQFSFLASVYFTMLSSGTSDHF